MDSGFRLVFADFRRGQGRFEGVDPSLAFLEQALKSLDLICIGPEDPVSLNWRLARVEPAAAGPVAQFLMAHAEGTGQVGQPPFVFAEELIVRPLAAEEAAAFEELIDDGRGEGVAALGWMEAFGGERGGDLGGSLPRRAQFR